VESADALACNRAAAAAAGVRVSEPLAMRPHSESAPRPPSQLEHLPTERAAALPQACRAASEDAIHIIAIRPNQKTFLLRT
jgi:hypothetical protein